MKMAGVPLIVGQSHLAVRGRKLKLTTENAVTTAMYEAIMLVMWWYHHAFRSVGGLTKARMSRTARKRPTIPSTTATTPSRCHVDEEDARSPVAHPEGRDRDDGHGPEVDLAPAPVRGTALDGQERAGRHEQGDGAGQHMDPE